MPTRPLTPKQQRFVQEYLVDLNGAAAYRRAGYTVGSDTVARVEACRLLANPNVAAAIQAAQQARAERTEVTQDWVVRQLVWLAENATNEAVKVAALKLLGLHLGMFTQRHQIGGDPESPPVRLKMTAESLLAAGRQLAEQLRAGRLAARLAAAGPAANQDGHASNGTATGPPRERPGRTASHPSAWPHAPAHTATPDAPAELFGLPR
jgi:phage terminase small subunit